MNITFLGDSCFRLKGKQAIVIINPFDKHQNKKMPKRKADIVCFSNRSVEMKRIKGEPFVITEPGEYEVNGVSVFGLSINQKTVYLIEIDDLRICHLGDLHTKLSNKQRDEINGVDILMLPLTGKEGLNTKKALQVVGQIEPKIVIPMNYEAKKSSRNGRLIDEFLKQADIDKVKPKTKLKISSSSAIAEEEAKIVILKRKT